LLEGILDVDRYEPQPNRLCLSNSIPAITCDVLGSKSLIMSYKAQFFP